MGSLDDEEESDEARGGSTENEAKRRSHQEMRPRKRGKGKRRGTERQGEKKKERAERVTAVGEVQAGPFTARTKKTNRREETSQARCLGLLYRSVTTLIAVQSRLSSSLSTIIIELVYIFGLYFSFYSSSTYIFRSWYITRSKLIHIRGRRFERCYSLDM